MIPQLWVCTSHPWLTLLALPLHPVAMLSVVVAAWLAAEPSARWKKWAIRLRCTWQVLWGAAVGAFLTVATAGWVVSQLGADADPIFQAARYLWVGLAWVALGLSWGARSARALTDADVARPRALRGAPGCLALIALVYASARVFVPDALVPLSLPYQIGDFLFDRSTMSIASDECLAARSVRDSSALLPGYPASLAESRLIAHGRSAVPGVVDYIEDRVKGTPDVDGAPGAVSIWLLALVAKYGDHPVLSQFEKFRGFQIGEIRQCLKSGGQVVPLSGTWRCEP